MSKSNLIPERVLTKDGNSVIRWVKADKKKSSKSGSLPAPGLMGQHSAGDTFPKKEKKEQKAARKAENARQLDYIQTEAKLRLKFKGNRYFTGSDISEVLKALREDGQSDPEYIVDEDLLISYAEFKELAWQQHSEGDGYISQRIGDSEAVRQQVNKLAKRYVTHPEERESLARAVRRGEYEYDKAMNALQMQ